ncbi:MAG: hypothetical protein D6775_15405 [Caldilineae bacterium]|nr:MAG: hypothetical protein D6775_15405 [Caldilineae bacterium]
MKQLSRLGRHFDLNTFILAFLLALVVWVVSVQQENPFETQIINRVNVTIRNLPEDLVFAEGSVNLSPVDVRVRAPRNVLQTLATRDMIAYVDLSEAEPGRQEFPVRVESQVSEVEIMDVFPDAVIIRLERKAEKAIPVSVRISDSPPFGYIAGTPVVTPPEVTVRGAESQVNNVAEAEVSLRLLDARSDVQVTEFVTLRDQNGATLSGLSVEPRTVSVLVPVEQQQGFDEKPVLPRLEGQPAANHVITGVSVEPATVTLFGDPDALASMDPFVETIPINIDGATEDIEERVPIIVPESVSVISAQAVTVHIGVQPIEGTLTMTLHPVVQGLGQGLQVQSISPATIDVILRGPLPRLQALQADQNARAVLELANLEAGVYKLVPIMLLPEDVQVQTILPETVQVTIEAVPTSTPTPTPTLEPATETPTPAPTATATPTPSLTPADS